MLYCKRRQVNNNITRRKRLDGRGERSEGGDDERSCRTCSGGEGGETHGRQEGLRTGKGFLFSNLNTPIVLLDKEKVYLHNVDLPFQ